MSNALSVDAILQDAPHRFHLGTRDLWVCYLLEHGSITETEACGLLGIELEHLPVLHASLVRSGRRTLGLK